MSAAEQHGLSAEDLDQLTDEERAAIEDGAQDAAEQEALSRAAQEGGEDEDEEDGEGTPAQAEPEPEAAPAAPEVAPAPAATEAEGEAAAPAAPPESARKAAPAYTADLPADIEEQQKAITDKLAALREQFRAGDVDVDDYETQRETLAGEREKLGRAITKAEIAREMEQQNAQQQWQAAIEDTFAKAALPEGGGIDYKKDAAKAADLDALVRRLAENPANADKTMGWFLSEGHRLVRAMYGVAPAAKPAPPKPADRTAPIRAVPASLAQVPGADGPGDIGSEFADVDALDGDDLEQAISKMTPAQRAKYEQGR